MSTRPPILPTPPTQYNREYMDQLLLVLRLYFDRQADVSHISAATLNIDLRTLPTQEDYDNLRPGDVYRDEIDDNCLKVKV